MPNALNNSPLGEVAKILARGWLRAELEAASPPGVTRLVKAPENSQNCLDVSGIPSPSVRKNEPLHSEDNDEP